MFDFEKFSVYKKTEKFLGDIQFLFRNKYIDLSIKNQLRRASSSILLNIAEGAGKTSSKDKKNFYTISRGSAQECVAILKILKIEGNLTQKLNDQFDSDLTEICKMLSGLIKRMNS